MILWYDLYDALCEMYAHAIWIIMNDLKGKGFRMIYKYLLMRLDGVKRLIDNVYKYLLL